MVVWIIVVFAVHFLRMWKEVSNEKLLSVTKLFFILNLVNRVGHRPTRDGIAHSTRILSRHCATVTSTAIMPRKHSAIKPWCEWCCSARNPRGFEKHKRSCERKAQIRDDAAAWTHRLPLESAITSGPRPQLSNTAHVTLKDNSDGRFTSSLVYSTDSTLFITQNLSLTSKWPLPPLNYHRLACLNLR